MATDVLVNFVQRWLKQATPEHQAQLLPLPEVPPLSRIQNLPLCIVFKCLLLHPTKGCEGRDYAGSCNPLRPWRLCNGAFSLKEISALL